MTRSSFPYSEDDFSVYLTGRLQELEVSGTGLEPEAVSSGCISSSRHGQFSDVITEAHRGAVEMEQGIT